MLCSSLSYFKNMTKYKPVSISKAGFAFCRYTIAILVWVSFLLKIKWLLIIVLLILAISAWLRVQRAPLVVLYEYTINKIIKSKEEILNEYAMKFAHTMGTILCLICLVFLYFVDENIGWGIVFLFAILKTISAVGMCPASKLYNCMGNKNCCAFMKKL